LQHAHVFEGVVLQRIDEFRLERRAAAGRAKSTVTGRSAGPARNLGKFSRIEPAELIAVIFAGGWERGMVDVEIEAHADRIGRDEIIDIAVLEHRHLRISGTRRERTEHDRSAAMLAADQFGDRVDLVGGESDNRGTPWLAGDLAV